MRILGSILFSSLVFLPSCKSVYKCGDPVPAKKSAFWGKRLKSVVKERDILCARISENDSVIDGLIQDTLRLSHKLNQCYTSVDSISDLYDELNEFRLSDAEQYNKALKQKSEELSAKESQLAEREKALQELRSALKRKDDAADALNKSITDALKGFKSDELQVSEKDGKVYVSLSDKLLFPSGSATVNKKGHDALEALAQVMKKNKNIDIDVEGHTDNVPYRTKAEQSKSNGIYVKDNWDLSVVRATSVVKILTEEYGVNPRQVVASGRAEYYPKSDNSTESGRSINRRTEIIISPNIDEVLNLIKSKN